MHLGIGLWCIFWIKKGIKMIQLLKRIFGMATIASDKALDDIEGVQGKAARLITQLREDSSAKVTAVANFSALNIKYKEKDKKLRKDLERAKNNFDNAIYTDNAEAQMAFGEDIQGLEAEIKSNSEQIESTEKSLIAMREQISILNNQITDAERIAAETVANAEINKANKQVGSAFAKNNTKSAISQLNELADKTKTESYQIEATEELVGDKNAKIKEEFEQKLQTSNIQAMIDKRKGELKANK